MEIVPKDVVLWQWQMGFIVPSVVLLVPLSPNPPFYLSLITPLTEDDSKGDTRRVIEINTHGDGVVETVESGQIKENRKP